MKVMANPSGQFSGPWVGAPGMESAKVRPGTSGM